MQVAMRLSFARPCRPLRQPCKLSVYSRQRRLLRNRNLFKKLTLPHWQMRLPQTMHKLHQRPRCPKRWWPCVATTVPVRCAQALRLPKIKDASPLRDEMDERGDVTMHAHVVKTGHVHRVWLMPRSTHSAKPWSMLKRPCENCRRKRMEKC